MSPIDQELTTSLNQKATRLCHTPDKWLHSILLLPEIQTRSLCVCRVHFPRLECRTDATHVLRCTLGTGVRILNWTLAASAGFSALCLAAGISRSGLVCRMLEVWLLDPWACLAALTCG